MKKTIRLSESDLHRVIEESVRQCLTELNWQTYANYQQGRMAQANQARENGDYEKEKMYRQKAIQGGNAAGEAMRQKHGFDSIDDFNRTAQKARNGQTLPETNPKYQNYMNYQKDAQDYYSRQ